MHTHCPFLPSPSIDRQHIHTHPPLHFPTDRTPCSRSLIFPSPQTSSPPPTSYTYTYLHTNTVEFDLMLPYGSGSYDTLALIEHDFGGAGVAFPYKLLFVDLTTATTNERCVG